MRDIQKIKLDVIRIKHSLRKRSRKDGGPGSGNWGHEGRPGSVGGSAEGGGSHNRISDPNGGYTSSSKQSKKTVRLTAKEAIQNAFVPGLMYIKDGKRFTPTKKKGVYICEQTGEKFEPWEGDEVRVISPSNNYKITQNDRAAMALNESRFKEAFNPSSAEEADAKYRELSGKVWNDCTDEEKNSLVQYTGDGFTNINGALRSGRSTAEIDRHIDNITRAIDKSVLSEDAILQRGMSTGDFEKLFGLPKFFLQQESPSLVGRVGTDDGFASTGSSVGTGHNEDVSLEILAPAGTKALYVEPFSVCGDGDVSYWDGKSKQSTFSDEDETILQRGTSFQILEVNKNEGSYRVKVAIVGQDYENSGYQKGRSGS